ncbi:MAG: hypothetical protein JWQ95_1059 [Sphaerisporangium sp.]|nr:hypothetical protein [Sphaerisporangium sp.]
MVNFVDIYAADLETALWVKSSYTANNGQCVEIANVPGLTLIAIRDSKNAHIPPARVSGHAWAHFLRAVTSGIWSKAEPGT